MSLICTSSETFVVFLLACLHPIVVLKADRVEELREGTMVVYRRKVAAVKGESLVGLSDYRCTITISTGPMPTGVPIIINLAFDRLSNTLVLDHLAQHSGKKRWARREALRLVRLFLSVNKMYGSIPPSPSVVVASLPTILHLAVTVNAIIETLSRRRTLS